MEFPLRKIEQANPLTAEERAALLAVCQPERVIEAGTDLVKEGDKPGHSTVLLSGLLSRYRILPEGNRQILAYHTAGDWPDLHSFFLTVMDHSLRAMTRCRVAHIPHPVLQELVETHPRLALLLWRETMLDSAIFREWVVNLGARDALKRTAHLFCELQAKLAAVGLGDDSGFELPLTQSDLADSIGVSPVHMNRVLQQMKREELITYGRGFVAIHDCDRLRQVGGFDPAYLHIRQPLAVED